NPFTHAAGRVADRHHAGQEVAIGAVPGAETVADLAGSPRLEGKPPGRLAPLAIIGMHGLQPTAVLLLLLAQAGRVLACDVGRALAAWRHSPNCLGGRTQERPQAPLTVLECLFVLAFVADLRSTKTPLVGCIGRRPGRASAPVQSLT